MWTRDNESRGWLLVTPHLLNFARSLGGYVAGGGQILVEAQNLIQFNLQKEGLLLLGSEIYRTISLTSFPLVSPLSNHSTVTLLVSTLMPETTAECIRPEKQNNKYRLQYRYNGK